MYKATDVRLGRKVALKVIAEHITSDPEFRERFVDEARNTSAVDHAHVVPLYDFGEVDGLLYIAMRLVDGSDLAKLIKDGPIAPTRVLILLGQVADALDLVHERGLVHLDVKPANVLVTAKETTGEHVYLADFGLTRRGATGHRTQTGDFLGSPTYAAPEHLRGEPVDGRTDLYALACVLFACLTGRPPFKGRVPDVIAAHLAGQPPAVSSIVALHPAIDAVIYRGMAKNPADRYADCRGLLAAARSALVRSANPARPPVPRLPAAQVDGGLSGPHSGSISSSISSSISASISGGSGASIVGGGVHPVGVEHSGPLAPRTGRPPTPPGGSAVFPPPARFPAGTGARPAEPVRLRPPLPVPTRGFGPTRPTGTWRLPLLIAVLVVAVLAVVFLVVF